MYTHDINMNTTEGKLLLIAIARLSQFTYKDKSNQQVLELLIDTLVSFNR